MTTYCQDPLAHSVLRGTNHFVRDDLTGNWILIDGLWKEHFDWYYERHGYTSVLVPWVDPIPWADVCKGPPDPYVEYGQLEWLLVQWMPHKHLFGGVSQRLRDKWHEFARGTIKFGWMIKGGGLPCYPGKAAAFYEDFGEIYVGKR